MYLQILTLSPSVITENYRAHCTNGAKHGGKHWPSLHQLKLRHIPLTAPACAFTIFS